MAEHSEILERLARIEATIEHLELRLFGDGQPGTLGRLYHRVNRLERFLWMGVGAAAVLSSVVSVCFAHYLKH